MAQFRYPGNLSEKHPVQTRISIYKRFNALGSVLDDGGGLTMFKKTAKTAEAAAGEGDKATEAQGEFTDAANQIAKKQLVDTTEGVLATIYLYAPSSIQFSDGFAYDNQEMGILASAVFDAVDNATAAGRDINNLEMAGNFASGFFAASASAVGKRAGIAQQVRLRTGVARNPRTEMQFKTPNMRQLSLTWKLMPTNAQESETVFAMINKMRQHAYPSTGNSGRQFAFAFPDIFQIDFVTRGGGKAQMIQFAKAYCTGINTTYGSSGPAFFKGGRPVEIDLTMTFQEAEIQTRESITALDGGQTGAQQINSTSPATEPPAAVAPEDDGRLPGD